MTYHNNYFNKSETSHRRDLYTRLNNIEENITKGKRLLDVGCSGGFNSFGLAKHFEDIDSFDFVPGLVDDCLKIQKENGTDINFYVSNVADEVKKDNSYDTILYLSTHHHVVNQFGLEKASEFLKSLFENCNEMFFDMGQKDEGPCDSWWHKLPEAVPNQETWLKNYLSVTTGASKLKQIGFTNIHNTKRLLWKISK